MLYIYTTDGSWAPACDTIVIAVPEELKTADEIEEFLVNFEDDPAPPSVEYLYDNQK